MTDTAAVSTVTDHPNVRRFLDLSTAHLHPDTRDSLDSLPVPSYPHPDACAYFVWVPPIVDGHDHFDDWEHEDRCAYPDLMAALRFARDQRCDYVLFDADAPACDGLPVYDHGGELIEDEDEDTDWNKAINGALSLDALCDALNQRPESDDDDRIDMSNLPTFGGAEPDPYPAGIWSWDETRLLVGECAPYRIVARADLEKDYCIDCNITFSDPPKHMGTCPECGGKLQ